MVRRKQPCRCVYIYTHTHLHIYIYTYVICTCIYIYITYIYMYTWVKPCKFCEIETFLTSGNFGDEFLQVMKPNVLYLYAFHSTMNCKPSRSMNPLRGCELRFPRYVALLLLQFIIFVILRE